MGLTFLQEVEKVVDPLIISLRSIEISLCSNHSLSPITTFAVCV